MSNTQDYTLLFQSSIYYVLIHVGYYCTNYMFSWDICNLLISGTGPRCNEHSPSNTLNFYIASLWFKVLNLYMHIHVFLKRMEASIDIVSILI